MKFLNLVKKVPVCESCLYISWTHVKFRPGTSWMPRIERKAKARIMEFFVRHDQATTTHTYGTVRKWGHVWPADKRFFITSLAAAALDSSCDPAPATT